MKNTAEQKTVIAMARMTQEEFAAAGLVVGVDAEGTSTCYDDGRMDVKLYTADGVRKAESAGFTVDAEHTNEFWGTPDSTYYVDSMGKVWWVLGVDNYPDSRRCDALPVNAEEIDGQHVDDNIIEHAMKIERRNW